MNDKSELSRMKENEPERKTRYVPAPEEAASWEKDAKRLCCRPFART